MVNRIIKIEDNKKTLQFAGEELLKHLNMLPLTCDAYSGSAVTFRLLPDPDPERDRCHYIVTEQESIFEGSNPRSVLLAVYDYLRRLGFVYYIPGQGGTYVPGITDSRTLLCPSVQKEASFLHRGVCIEGADSVENVLDFIDWLPKNGYNSFFLQFKKPDTFLERWYNHFNNPLVAPEHPGQDDFDAMDAQITDAMVLRDLIVHRVGHGWTAGALGCEATGWDTEKNELSPEMLSLTAEVNGKHQLFYGVPTNTNLCYHNPTARKRLIDQVVEYAASHRSVDYLHFWLADTANNVCECADCRQTTLSDQYVSILNELDLALDRAGLDTKIVFLLYQELLYVPVHERIQNPDRFCLMFAPISRTFEKSYPRIQTSVPVTPYVRNQFRFPETVEENLSHYFNWKKIYSGNCFFYDYPLGRAHYGDFGYMKISRVIYDDIHSLKELGSNGYMSCQELRAMTPTGFPNFVMGQALFDDSLPYDQLKETYFSGMFGPGYEHVILYLEQLSELSDTDYFNGHGPRKQPEKRNRFAAITETARAFLADMDNLHGEDPQYQKNWDFLKFHGRYCILLSAALAELCDGNQAEADRNFSGFCDYIRENEPEWQSRLDVYRVIEIAVNYTGFSRP